MRLPLVIPLDARASALTKDARLTNTVAESYEGRKIVSARPSLTELSPLTGAAGGVVCFDNELLAIAGTKIYATVSRTRAAFEFSGPDGTNTITNTGDGGLVTDSPGFPGQLISTSKSYSGGSSLRLLNDHANQMEDLPFTIAFFEGNYKISFQFYITSGDLIPGGGEAFVSLIEGNTDMGDFYKWDIDLLMVDGELTCYLSLVNIGATVKRWTLPVSPDVWGFVEIEKSKDQYLVQYRGKVLTPDIDDPMVVDGVVIENILFYGYQFDTLWSANEDQKLFIDDFTVSSLEVGDTGKTLVAGQYDFARGLS